MSDSLSVIVRLKTPAGAFFPVQRYLQASAGEVPTEEDWGDRVGAEVFPYVSADVLARRLTRAEAHVYPVVLERSEAAQVRRATAVAACEASVPADWHAGKPNCGVD